MVIPSDRAIQAKLLKYLAGCPEYRAHAQKCYAELEPLFPDLTHEDVLACFAFAAERDRKVYVSHAA